jgi:hypothetical protein
VTYTPNAGFFSTDSFTYTVEDANGLTDTGTVTITQNFVPIIPEPVVLRLDENETFAGNVAAFDFEGDPIEFSIAGGADAALFEIDPVTGGLSFLAAPDFETPLAADQTINGGNTYFVDVTATDPFGAATSTIEVVVQDVDENPNTGPFFTAYVSQGRFGEVEDITEDPIEAIIFGNDIVDADNDGVPDTAFAIGDADADDLDGDTITFSLQGQDRDTFNIDATTGEITLARTLGIKDSFDNDDLYEFSVMAEDGNGGTAVLNVEYTFFSFG